MRFLKRNNKIRDVIKMLFQITNIAMFTEKYVKEIFKLVTGGLEISECKYYPCTIKVEANGVEHALYGINFLTRTDYIIARDQQNYHVILYFDDNFTLKKIEKPNISEAEDGKELTNNELSKIKKRINYWDKKHPIIKDVTAFIDQVEKKEDFIKFDREHHSKQNELSQKFLKRVESNINLREKKLKEIENKIKNPKKIKGDFRTRSKNYSQMLINQFGNKKKDLKNKHRSKSSS